jgi:predicted nucleotide-binding protein
MASLPQGSDPSEEVVMLPRTRLFIGSSSRRQSLQVVEIIRTRLESLDPSVEVLPWREEFRPSGRTIVESLEEIAAQVDFALMVLGDDEMRAEPRDDGAAAPDAPGEPARFRRGPRDNVIFELGIFSGLLGRDRCIVVHDQAMDLKLPSDIDGIVAARYDRGTSGDLHAALAVAVDTIHRTLRGTVAPRRPRPSDVEAWQALRTFSRNIEGFWWSLRDWDVYNSLAFVHLSLDPATSMPSVSGRAYRWDGAPLAHWESDATCVRAEKARLYYHFTGYHVPTNPREADQASEEYRGFTEYAFDPPWTAPARGRGKMWDTNLTRRLTRTQLTLTLHRCEVDRNISGSDITTMVEGSDRARIAGIVQRMLPHPPRMRAVMRRLFP